jgi:hypothetical protein
MSLQNDLVTKKADTNLFYSAFLSQVLKYGRSYEMGLMLKYFMFNHPIALIKQVPLGMRMMMEGAMPIFPHKVKKLKEFEKIISHAKKLEKDEILNN